MILQSPSQRAGDGDLTSEIDASNASVRVLTVGVDVLMFGSLQHSAGLLHLFPLLLQTVQGLHGRPSTRSPVSASLKELEEYREPRRGAQTD